MFTTKASIRIFINEVIYSLTFRRCGVCDAIQHVLENDGAYEVRNEFLTFCQEFGFISYENQGKPYWLGPLDEEGMILRRNIVREFEDYLLGKYTTEVNNEAIN